MKTFFKYQKWDKTLILEGEHEKITFLLKIYGTIIALS